MDHHSNRHTRMFTIHFILITLLAATNGLVGKSCFWSSGCGEDECCQAPTVKRNLDDIIIQIEPIMGICQKFSSEGQGCTETGPCRCGPGLECHDFADSMTTASTALGQLLPGEPRFRCRPVLK